LKEEARDDKATSAMPDRYSDQKLEAAVDGKGELVTTIANLVATQKEKFIDCEWVDIYPYFASRRKMRSLWLSRRRSNELPQQATPAKVHTTLIPIMDQELSPKRLAPRITNKQTEISEDSGEESPSNHSPSNSSEAPSASDVSCDEEDFEEIAWLQAIGKKGHLHLLGEVDKDSIRSRCGRKLHRPDPGHGVEEAIGTGAKWSPRCYAHLPRGVRQLLTQRAPLSVPA
jgi:hypothetical protein